MQKSKNIPQNIKKIKKLLATQTCYDKHYYLYVVRNREGKENKVLRINSKDFPKVLDGAVPFPFDAEVLIGVNPMKKRYVSDTEMNTYSERGAKLHTYELKQNACLSNYKGNPSFNEKETGVFSYKNIVVSIQMYKKNESADIEYTFGLINEFKAAINGLISSDYFVRPNIVSFCGPVCELWYCTNENSKKLKWLYDFLFEHITTKVNFHCCNIRLNSDRYIRVRAVEARMAHLITPASDVTVTKDDIYDVDELKKLAGFKVINRAEYVSDNRGHIEKVVTSKSDFDGKNYLFDRLNVLEELRKYTKNISGLYSEGELIAFQKRLNYLYFSTSAAAYGTRAAVLRVKAFNNKSAYRSSDEYIENEVIAKALATTRQHYYFTTEKFVEAAGILGEEKYEDVKKRLTYAISSTARVRRYRARQKEKREAAFKVASNRLVNMYKRTGDIELCAKECGFSVKKAKKIVKKADRDMYRKMGFNAYYIIQRKIFGYFLQLKNKEAKAECKKRREPFVERELNEIPEKELRKIIRLVAKKYKCTRKQITDIIEKLSAVRDRIRINTTFWTGSAHFYRNFRFCDIDRIWFDYGEIVLPHFMADDVNLCYGGHMPTKIVSQVLLSASQSGWFKKTFGHKFSSYINLQMALEPNTRLLFSQCMRQSRLA